MLTSLGGDVFEFQDEDDTFKVAFTHGQVFLYGDFGAQIFTYFGEPTLEGLRSTFPTRESAVNAAQLHTRGLLDRSGFIEDLKVLKEQGVLLQGQLEELEALAKACNCAPVKFLEKLVARGHSSVVGKARVYQELPLFTLTIDALMKVIAAILV